MQRENTYSLKPGFNRQTFSMPGSLIIFLVNTSCQCHCNEKFCYEYGCHCSVCKEKISQYKMTKNINDTGHQVDLEIFSLHISRQQYHGARDVQANDNSYDTKNTHEKQGMYIRIAHKKIKDAFSK